MTEMENQKFTGRLLSVYVVQQLIDLISFVTVHTFVVYKPDRITWDAMHHWISYPVQYHFTDNFDGLPYVSRLHPRDSRDCKWNTHPAPCVSQNIDQYLQLGDRWQSDLLQGRQESQLNLTAFVAATGIQK
ncbi:hypothetical protein EDC04DRAFT_2601931 [Pisolithus marmoratus]|nr:hypothetical protein EDC04DRAFT_2601931 [Pisolithus marmoratus]